jgi:hypothetical protein
VLHAHVEREQQVRGRVLLAQGFDRGLRDAAEVDLAALGEHLLERGGCAPQDLHERSEDLPLRVGEDAGGALRTARAPRARRRRREASPSSSLTISSFARFSSAPPVGKPCAS